jgi:hypothetical protein
MDYKNLSRKEKEDLYIQKETELQIHWGNPLDGDWNYVKEWTEQELESRLEQTIQQLKFERGTLPSIKSILLLCATLICIFIGLGIVGLLYFGVKQLF